MISNILFLTLMCIWSVASDLEAVNGRIKITTLTTAGCIPTRNFITNQLTPTYAVYGEYLDIEYVPWGRTTRHPNGTYDNCQFSPNNCWANRLHRCVLNFLKDNQDAQVKYMGCEFGIPQPAFEESSYICAQNEGLNLVEVDYCVRHPFLDDLDDIAEEASRAPMDPVEGINSLPVIVFNDTIDMRLHTQARDRLQNMVCLALGNSNDTAISISSCQKTETG
ncbi:GILT-like protein 1 [Achroia grisella]|uniref:GILT-like protein 1 n=1 Tax=Achroia grisella TaxID=688607 RepID=UPI0027D2AB78|nr:GILT-like protein 1 [Achroia grisella]